LFGKERNVPFEDHLMECIKEIYASRPLLTIQCYTYENYFSPNVSRDKAYKLLISLWNNEGILIDADDMSFIELQCIQKLFVNSFRTTDHRKGTMVFKDFAFNSIFYSRYNPNDLIRALFKRVKEISLKHPYLSKIVGDIVNNCDNNIKSIWNNGG
jgi:hypothetical protein